MKVSHASRFAMTMTFLTSPPSEPTVASSTSNECQAAEAILSEPAWVFEKRDMWGEHFTLPEWEDDIDGEHEGFRSKHGWKVSLWYDACTVVDHYDYYYSVSMSCSVLRLAFRAAIIFTANPLL